MSGPMSSWSVTDDLIDAVKKDLETSTGYSASGLSSRIDMALDTLDAKHLDSMAYLLSMVTLQVKRMAVERQAQEDVEQLAQFNRAEDDRLYNEMQDRTEAKYMPPRIWRDAQCTCGSRPHALHCPLAGPFPGARWTGALD